MINILKVFLKKKGGRNNKGIITVRHRGGGYFFGYKKVVFNVKYIFGKFLKLKNVLIKDNMFYRNSFISLFCSENGFLLYRLSVKNLVENSIINVLPFGLNSLGNTILLAYVVRGAFVHNISSNCFGKFKYVRSAGCFGVVLKKYNDCVAIKMPSKFVKFFPHNFFVTLGVLANEGVKFIKLGKAGCSRRLGIRPSVRGVAMNPIDHPHGGGQGKTKGGRRSVSIWGWLTKGKKFVKYKNHISLLKFN